ncbi:sigma-54-dependent Fis family transcriptional regulator [Luteitalea sp. TBR-22]|uniref:sigma-54 interaction domain-containing protein n=1 Tax=Luteitalea sp. TBR-22 TaxID=2802971 RepID=UPI001EF537F4|nr:sigma-54 dependent transcriptional regulator [Luteitalea sp. TBR-22]
MLKRLGIRSTLQADPSPADKVGTSALYVGTVGRSPIYLGAEVPELAEKKELLFHVFSITRRAVDGVRAQSELKQKLLSWDLDIAPEGKAGLYISSGMKRLLKTITRAAASDIPVLITGETGTGKEIVATELHACSPRSAKPFIALNVAAVPREMLEGHLFGYKRGAFTGAVNDAKGMIREAEGGTLFIDEIGELSLDLQPKLLRFLESGEIQPLGERPQRVDVRIVAATNARLESLVREGRFREDLFYRLNVVSLTVPPLRERREEIPTLVNHFLTTHAKQAGKLIPQLTPRALERLSAYDWPGNVRQLTNELKRIVALSDADELVDLEHLAPGIRNLVEAPAPRPSDGSTVTLALDRDLQGLYDDLERAAILRAMDVSRQNQSECARRLGITRKGLYLKRKRLGLADDTVADEEDDDLTPARSAS